MSTNWIRQERLLRDLFDTNMYSGYVPMIPEAEGITQGDLQDATAFNNWVDLVINGRLAQVWSRMAAVEKNLNTTGTMVPGYLRNYVASLCNPYFQKDFRYEDVSAYEYSLDYDSHGAEYDWESKFGAGSKVALFPVTGAVRLEEGDYYALVYKNGRPVPSDRFELHDQHVNYSLFMPFESSAMDDLVEDDDLISVEMRRHWNLPRWYIFTVGGTWNGTDPFEIADIDKIGYPYCYDTEEVLPDGSPDLGDFLVYVRKSGEDYFKRMSRSFYTAREDGAQAKKLILTFEAGHGLSADDEVAVANNSAGWIIDIQTSAGGEQYFDLICEGYEYDPSGDPGVFTGRETTDFNALDPTGTQAQIDKMPLPVEDEDEVAVMLYVPGVAGPRGYRLVPGWDFNLINNSGGDSDPVQLKLNNGTLPAGSHVRIIKQEPGSWFMVTTRASTTPTDGIVTLLRHERFPVGVAYADVVLNNQYVAKYLLENVSDAAFRVKEFPSNESLYVKYTVPKNDITRELNEDIDDYRSDLEKYLYLIGFYIDPTSLPGVYAINDLHCSSFTVKGSGAFTPTDLYEHPDGDDLYDELLNYGDAESQKFRIKADGEVMEVATADTSEVVAARFVAEV